MIFSWIFSNNDLMKKMMLYCFATAGPVQFHLPGSRCTCCNFLKPIVVVGMPKWRLLPNPCCKINDVPTVFFLNSHTYHLILILRQVEAFWGSKCIFESLVLNIWVFFPSCSRRHWKLNLHLGSIKNLPSKRHLDSVSVKKDWKLKDSSNWWLTGWWFTFSIHFRVC